RTATAARALVDTILGDEPGPAAVAATRLNLWIDSEGLQRLRDAVQDRGQREKVRRQAIMALCNARDVASLPWLLEVARSEPPLAEELVRGLGRMGGATAAEILAGMLTWRPDYEWQSSIVRALGETCNASARDALLYELALRPSED